MGASFAFFRFVAKAALNSVGGGVLGDFTVETLPEIARGVWGRWNKDRKPEELRQEVQALAALPLVEARQQAAEAVAQEATGQPETVRQALTAYLAQVPNAIRQSQRRPADPSGRSVSALLSLRRAEDLIPLLPSRPPRFTVGERPKGVGDWELEELLGVGGFGEVWKARNPFMPEPIALKFCLDSEAAKALRNEAALLGRVCSQGRHPGIVRLLHTYLSADPPCLAYEFVAGGDLTGLVYQQVQKYQGKLPPDLVVKIVRSLARAMQFPHQLTPPIVHRDLKPANILVQRGADKGVTFRITDFGIGGVAASQAIKQAGGASTGHFQATALRGAHTPLYASPQQKEGADPDPRDDVYALGVIWYQMLIGDLSKEAPRGNGWKIPFRERGMAAAELELLQECFEEDPGYRIADAGALVLRLEGLGKIVSVGNGTTPPPGNGVSPADDKVPKRTENGGGTAGTERPDQTGGTVVPPTKTAAASCAEGDAFLQRQEYTPAIKAYTQALKIDARLAAAYRSRARAYFGKGDRDKALADLTELVKLDSKDPEVHVLRGIAYRERGAADKALADLTTAIMLGLRSAGVYTERGLAYADKGVADLALADFDEALRCDPGSAAVYFHRGHFYDGNKAHDRALADYSEAIRLDATQARFFNARGMAYYHKGEADLAVADLIQALRLAPELAEGYHNRGQVYARKGNFEQAVADYSQALKLGLKSGRVYYHRGLAQARLQKPSLAVADFTRAIKASPRNAEIYLMRGLAHVARQDHAAAITDFTCAIHRDKKYTAAYHNRARAYLESGKYGKAVKDFTQVIQHSPRRADAFDGRARAYCLKKQYDEAIADATEAIRLNPACASAYAHRSGAHAGKGDLVQAIADATEAIRQAPQAAHYAARGHAYHERGEYDLALADFTAAIKLDPGKGELYRSRSRVYAKKGDAAKADADRKKALKLGGKQEKAPGRKSPKGHVTTLGDIIAAGLLSPSAKLFCRYKGTMLEATLLADGAVEFQQQRYDTCSAAAEAARATVAGRKMNTNGWDFWEYQGADGKNHTLSDARQQIEGGRSIHRPT